MKVRDRIGRLALVLIIGSGGGLGAVSAAWSQQRQSISYSVPPGAATYKQEHLIDVGDVPGHQVRVYEINVDYRNINLSFDGVKVKETWARGSSDYTNGSGTASEYDVWVLENGDKLFSKVATVGHASVAPDGSKVLKYTVVNTFTGGTGKFRGIRGQTLINAVRVPGAKTVAIDVTGEYWIEE
jgi:hypothetical protein